MTARRLARNQAALEIEASRNVLFDMLVEEAQAGVERGSAEIIASDRGRELAVDVGFGWAMTVRQTYSLERVRRGTTRVTATLSPRGFRWKLTNLLMLGRGMSALRNASETGLANLKQAAERGAGDDGDPPPGRHNDEGGAGAFTNP